VADRHFVSSQSATNFLSPHARVGVEVLVPASLCPSVVVAGGDSLMQPSTIASYGLLAGKSLGIRRAGHWVFENHRPRRWPSCRLWYV